MTESTDLLVKNGRLLDPASDTDRKVDIRIEGGIVKEIADASCLDGGQSHVIDAEGLWVLPGLVDLHVHLREPGQEYKEDIESGSRAAAHGGFTTIVAMPNTQPVVDNGEMVEFVASRGREAGHCRVLTAGAASLNQEGKQLAAIGEMARAGVVAISDDGRPVANPDLMRRVLEYCKDFGLVVLTHAEDLDLCGAGQMNEGAVSTRLGLRGKPAVGEDVAVARDILVAEYVDAPLHVCHVSTAGAVDLIRQAKDRGSQVTGEAAPHHFTLTDKAVEGYNTSTKMNPPLREERDRRAIVEGLKDGTLDAVATDHAPHSSLEKDVAYDDAANGIIGLETALPLTLDLWRQDALPLMTAIRLLTTGPASILGLLQGKVAVGGRGDLALVDPDAEWEVTDQVLVSKSKNTPFLGRTMKGRVMTTIFGGRLVCRRCQ